MSEKTFDFGIFSNEKQRSERAYISIDSQGRVYMNADAQKLFGITKSVPSEIQLGYKDGNVYLIKSDSKYFDSEKKPFRFSGDRAYASAKTFIEQAGIAVDPEVKKSQKYLLDENFTEFEGVYAFLHEDLMLAREEAEAAAKEKAEAEAAAKALKGGNRKNQAEAAAKGNKTVTA